MGKQFLFVDIIYIVKNEKIDKVWQDSIVQIVDDKIIVI